LRSDLLTSAMMTFGTDQVLGLAQHQNELYFWDDFLGDNDVDIFGGKLVRGEDRIFSTSVAINALIDTWSSSSQNCSFICIGDGRRLSIKLRLTWISSHVGPRVWRQNVPAKVKKAVTGGAQWLSKNMFTGKFAFENAFFSGSMKGMRQGPWFFPANRCGVRFPTPLCATFVDNNPCSMKLQNRNFQWHEDTPYIT
jgi:hypothetical protein